jgi:hypothetical protein
MTERSYQDAVQVLRNRLGGRWEGVELEGRDEMVRVLKDELGYDNSAANDAIDAMINSGELRYHRLAHDAGDAVPTPVVPAASGLVTGAPASGGSGALPLAAGLVAAGHWQIGPGEDDDIPGRRGQVTPS